MFVKRTLKTYISTFYNQTSKKQTRQNKMNIIETDQNHSVIKIGVGNTNEEEIKDFLEQNLTIVKSNLQSLLKGQFGRPGTHRKYL